MLRLYKEELGLASDNMSPAFLDAVALGDCHDRCLTCLGSMHAEVAFEDESSSHRGCSSRSCGQAPLPRQRGGAVAAVSI